MLRINANLESLDLTQDIRKKTPYVWIEGINEISPVKNQSLFSNPLSNDIERLKNGTIDDYISTFPFDSQNTKKVQFGDENDYLINAKNNADISF